MRAGGWGNPPPPHPPPTLRRGGIGEAGGCWRGHTGPPLQKIAHSCPLQADLKTKLSCLRTAACLVRGGGRGRLPTGLSQSALCACFALCCRHFKTVWPSGLRRWLQAPVRKGVGSNPTAVTLLARGAGGCDRSCRAAGCSSASACETKPRHVVRTVCAALVPHTVSPLLLRFFVVCAALVHHPPLRFFVLLLCAALLLHAVLLAASVLHPALPRLRALPCSFVRVDSNDDNQPTLNVLRVLLATASGPAAHGKGSPRKQSGHTGD